MSDSIIVSGADRKGPSWMIDRPFAMFYARDSSGNEIHIGHNRRDAYLWIGAVSIHMSYKDALKIVAEWRRRRAIRLMYK